MNQENSLTLMELTALPHAVLDTILLAQKYNASLHATGHMHSTLILHTILVKNDVLLHVQVEHS